MEKCMVGTEFQFYKDKFLQADGSDVYTIDVNVLNVTELYT